MSMVCNSDIIAGAYQPEIVTVETKTEIVTRYDEHTGKPYNKVIETRIIRVGKHELRGLWEVFDYLEYKLDHAGGLWDEGEKKNEKPNCVWGVKLEENKDRSFSLEAVESLLVETRKRFLELGIEIEPGLYHITEMG